jgi:3-oxoacyl-[acyl-carrier-protein] synthase II
MRRRVVITGMGIITAIGQDVPSFWKNLLQGICGIGEISLFDTRKYRTHLAAEVKSLEAPGDFSVRERRRLSRCDQLAWMAAREAVDSAGLRFEDEDRRRIGIFVGGGAGGILSAERYRRRMVERGPKRPRPTLLLSFSNCAVTDRLAQMYGILGPRMTVATACSSSATAIGLALWAIRRGEVDVAVAGGSESLSEVTFAGFNALQAVDERPCRPFDLNRKGLSLGEGGAFLILEEAERALRRRAPIQGELVGFGLSADGYHMTAPDPQGDGALRAMAEAVRDGEVGVEAVEAINAHGTATPANDVAETRAIKSLFGERAKKIPVSAIKSMVGHCLGAAGAIEAVATVLTVRDGRVPPTLHYETPDPECDLDYVAHRSRAMPVRLALSNSFAFGGNNTSLLFRRWEGSRKS